MTRVLVRAVGIFHTEGGNIARPSLRNRSHPKKAMARIGARVSVRMNNTPVQFLSGPSVRARLKHVREAMISAAPTRSTRDHRNGCVCRTSQVDLGNKMAVHVN